MQKAITIGLNGQLVELRIVKPFSSIAPKSIAKLICYILEFCHSARCHKKNILQNYGL